MKLEQLLAKPLSFSLLPYPMQEGGMVYARGYEAARKACLESFTYTGVIQCQPLIDGPGSIERKAEQALYREGYNALLKLALKYFEHEFETKGNLAHE